MRQQNIIKKTSLVCLAYAKTTADSGIIIFVDFHTHAYVKKCFKPINISEAFFFFKLSKYPNGTESHIQNIRQTQLAKLEVT